MIVVANKDLAIITVYAKEDKKEMIFSDLAKIVR